MKRILSLRVIIVSVLLLAGMVLAIYLDTQRQPASEDVALVEIKNIKTLRDRFNQDSGNTRLILLLSPT